MTFVSTVAPPPTDDPAVRPDGSATGAGQRPTNDGPQPTADAVPRRPAGEGTPYHRPSTTDPPAPAIDPEEVQRRRQQREAERDQLRTSRFDTVTSLFVALIVFIGIFVSMLFIIWLTTRWTWKPLPIEPIVENPAGRGDNAEGFERDFEPPGEEEVEDLLEPTLADSIEAVTDAVSSVAAALVAADTDSAASSQGAGGKGDNRPPGPEGEGDDIVPRFERWQLDFEARDADTYAKQLDFFNFELAVMGGGMKGVEAVSDVSKGGKKRLITDTGSEKRVYFQFSKATPLQKYEEELLRRAGATVDGKGRVTLKFIDPQTENMLAQMELAYAKSKGHELIQEVAKTIFRCEPDGGGYKFVVTSQRYRTPRW